LYRCSPERRSGLKWTRLQLIREPDNELYSAPNDPYSGKFRHLAGVSGFCSYGDHNPASLAGDIDLGATGETLVLQPFSAQADAGKERVAVAAPGKGFAGDLEAAGGVGLEAAVVCMLREFEAKATRLAGVSNLRGLCFTQRDSTVPVL
jgi:hypothetical protein